MSNPILRREFEGEAILEGDRMSVAGTINKSLILTATIILAASYVWSLVSTGFIDKAQILSIGGLIVAFIAGLVVVIARPKISNILSVVYAIGEGFCLGGISAYFEARFPGIVIKAVAGTFASMLAMLMLYRAGMIRATEKFRAVMLTAMASIALIYIIQIVATLFGRSIPQIFEPTLIGIGFSAIVVIIASLNFIMDFDMIDRSANLMAPKLYEWVCSVGLMFSLVWLYLELLNLFAKLSSRN